MTEEAFALQVQTESPTMTDGLRVDHPAMKEYIQGCVRNGLGNERICQLSGAPQEVVDKIRHAIMKEKRKS